MSWFHTTHPHGSFQQVKHLRFDHPVIYPGTFSPVFHQSCLTQHHQVL